MARLRPRCPQCDQWLPRARLACPQCSLSLVDPALRQRFEESAATLATQLQSRPWLRDGQLLPYVQRSLERGFLQRQEGEPDPDLATFLDELRSELRPPADRLLLEHLIAAVIRPRSRPLAAYLEGRLSRP